MRANLYSRLRRSRRGQVILQPVCRLPRAPSAGGVLPPVAGAERAGVFAPMIPLIRSTDQLFISQLNQQRIVVYGNTKKYEEPLKKLKGTFQHVSVTFSVPHLIHHLNEYAFIFHSKDTPLITDFVNRINWY